MDFHCHRLKVLLFCLRLSPFAVIFRNKTCVRINAQKCHQEWQSFVASESAITGRSLLKCMQDKNEILIPAFSASSLTELHDRQLHSQECTPPVPINNKNQLFWVTAWTKNYVSANTAQRKWTSAQLHSITGLTSQRTRPHTFHEHKITIMYCVMDCEAKLTSSFYHDNQQVEHLKN